jgi:hypothetical protein
MNNKTNAITAKIVEYRFIGKVQLNADDMGGVGCDNWNQYLNVCNALSVAAWNHTIGREIDADVVNTAIAGLLVKPCCDHLVFAPLCLPYWIGLVWLLLGELLA